VLLQAGTVRQGLGGIREALWKRWDSSQGLKGQKDSKMQEEIRGDRLLLSSSPSWHRAPDNLFQSANP
jgi:hypothetical protein